MKAAGLILGFLSTMIAVLSTYVETQKDKEWAANVQTARWWRYVNLANTLLPTLGGLFVSVLSRFRYSIKWAAVHSAAEEIESEIYKFRVKAGDYATFTSVKG